MSATDLIKADVDRASAPSGEDLVSAVVEADARFGLDLLARLTRKGNDNAFQSPFSIATALTMTLAGARGETASELADALGVTDLGDRVHAARNALDLRLTAPRASDGGTALALDVGNSLWGQAGFHFLQPFLDTLARHYGSGMHTVDFERATEDARVAINQWVAEQTGGRVEELLVRGLLDDLTAFVLVNTITFEASWRKPFDDDGTRPGTFTRADDTQVEVPMMHPRGGEVRTDYRRAAGWQAVRLPYVGDASMVLLLADDPDAELDVVTWSAIARARGDALVELSLPRFAFTRHSSLAGPLGELGLRQLFIPRVADLSGITDHEALFVKAVEHEAYVEVDERGTKAGAATAVVAQRTSRPPSVTVAFDRPFIFVIQDDATGEMLFVGRVADPTAT